MTGTELRQYYLRERHISDFPPEHEDLRTGGWSQRANQSAIRRPAPIPWLTLITDATHPIHDYRDCTVQADFNGVAFALGSVGLMNSQLGQGEPHQ